jgi:hypothetical protein
MADVFIGSEAVASGVLTRGQLRWNYRAIFPDVYIAKDTTPSLLQRAVGPWLWSGRRAVIAGLAAAALHLARHAPRDAMRLPKVIVYHVRAVVIERGYPLWRLQKLSRGWTAPVDT